MRLSFSACSLQEECEPREFEKIWSECADAAHGARSREPVLTRWEHAGPRAQELLKKNNDYERVRLSVVSAEMADSKRNAIASGLCSLLQEKRIVSLTCFLSCCNQDCWEPNCEWLVRIDHKTKMSGYQSHHVAVRRHVIEKRLESLATTCLSKEALTPFVTRRDARLEEEQRLLFEVLPSLLFTQAIATFKKCLNQWRSLKLLPLSSCGEHPVGEAVAKKALGMEISNAVFSSAVHKTNTHSPSFISCLFEDATAELLKTQCFCVAYEDDLKEMSNGRDIWSADL